MTAKPVDEPPQIDSDPESHFGLCAERCLLRWQATIEDLDVDGVSSQASVAQRLLRIVESALVQLGHRARANESDGIGDPAEHVLTGDNTATLRRGRELLARSELCGELPLLGEAIGNGTAPGESIDAVARAWRRLDEKERATFRERYDAELARRIVDDPPATFTRGVQYRARSVKEDDGLADAAADSAANEFRSYRRRNGRYVFELEVDSLTGEDVDNNLMRHLRRFISKRAPKRGGDVRSVGARMRSEAVVDLIRNPNRAKPSRGPSISIFVDELTALHGPHEATVCETTGGTHVPTGVLARLACEAKIESVHLNRDGKPFNMGRSERTATDRQRIALHALWGRCPFTDADFRRCQVHHLDGWKRDKGRTDLDNLVPLAPRIHHLIHDREWSLTRRSDGGLILRRPNGEIYRQVPPPVPMNRRRRDDAQSVAA